MKNRITCNDHDYFEMVCMRHSQVRITTADSYFSGIAKDIKISKGEEFLVLDWHNSSQTINLTDITLLEAYGNANDSHNFALKL